ncbi:MAG TPA: hemolysin family protein, partial [Anaerolineales bacterium]
NALYVAAEFSTVSARRSRLTHLASEGNRLARILVPIVRDSRKLDTYIAACQLGITASSLILGFYGQSQLTPVIAPFLADLGELSEPAAISITATGVLLFLTTLQVVLGELLPKSIGIQYPERLALLTTIPMRWSIALFKPLIWFFNGSGRLILKLTGFSEATDNIHIHSPQEIMMLFEESSAGGLLDEEERRLLRNSLQMRELAVRQVMIPRNHMLAASVDQDCAELLETLADSPFSRLPLYEESIDNIVGIVHLKDLLCLRPQTGRHDVREAMRPVLFVPETTPVDEVFAMLQRKRYHIAVVLDEYGGTEGIVTLEDLIEEIFGELQDEFDIETQPPIRVLSESKILIRGDMLVDELNEILNLYLPSEEIDTLGGLVLNELRHVPEEGERLKVSDVTLTVASMHGHGVTAVSMEISTEQMTRLKDWKR